MSSTEQPGDLPVDDQLIWRAFVADPKVGVSVIADDGTIIFANERSAQLFLGVKSSKVIGRNITELFPAEWTDERLALIRRICRTGNPVGLRSIWKGQRLHSFLYPVRAPSGTHDRALVITHLGSDHDELTPWGEPFVESRYIELGPLGVLTTRELEVLALLGQGMRIREAAAILFRSQKTIDKHRTSIGRKLKESDRVELAIIARNAGLRLSDAQLRRIRSSGPT